MAASMSTCLALLTALIAALLAAYYYTSLLPLPGAVVPPPSPIPDDAESARVRSVLAGLLKAEAAAAVDGDARVAVGFGGCLDVMADAVGTLERLGVDAPPLGAPRNHDELGGREGLAETFAYFFSHGASAGWVL